MNASDSSAAQVLREAVDRLGLPLDARQVQALLDYLSLLAKWNRVYNLTSVREPAQMLTHHLLDSLVIVPHLRQGLADCAPTPARSRVLDVGSGGGLPGVVLAIACPDIDVDCVDTVGKKAAFIQQVAAQLRLPNLRGLHARVENLDGPAYDLVCSRAFASLADFVRWSAGSLTPGGVWMAMKGQRPEDEMAALPPEVEVFHVEPLEVPGLDAQRCLVWLRRQPEAERAIT
jgi:16S rRNA (guanine527-N7)-methyltransferase